MFDEAERGGGAVSVHLFELWPAPVSRVCSLAAEESRALFHLMDNGDGEAGHLGAGKRQPFALALSSCTGGVEFLFNILRWSPFGRSSRLL